MKRKQLDTCKQQANIYAHKKLIHNFVIYARPTAVSSCKSNFCYLAISPPSQASFFVQNGLFYIKIHEFANSIFAEADLHVLCILNVHNHFLILFQMNKAARMSHARPVSLDVTMAGVSRTLGSVTARTTAATAPTRAIFAPRKPVPTFR